MAISTLPAVPGDLIGITQWLIRLRTWLHRSINTPAVNYVVLEKITVEPEKPLDGMLVYADGSDWDPGTGRGLYRYDEILAAWRFAEHVGIP